MPKNHWRIAAGSRFDGQVIESRRTHVDVTDASIVTNGNVGVLAARRIEIETTAIKIHFPRGRRTSTSGGEIVQASFT